METATKGTSAQVVLAHPPQLEEYVRKVICVSKDLKCRSHVLSLTTKDTRVNRSVMPVRLVTSVTKPSSCPALLGSTAKLRIINCLVLQVHISAQLAIKLSLIVSHASLAMLVLATLPLIATQCSAKKGISAKEELPPTCPRLQQKEEECVKKDNTVL